MRCPNCAGEIPAGSRFCGICGRNITVAPDAVAHALGDAAAKGRWQAAAAPAEAQPAAMSLFELPVSRGARTAKLALVLVLDAILAGAGIVMILSYLQARRGPEPAAKQPAPAVTGAVEVGAPKPVALPPSSEAQQVAPAVKKQEKTKQETGDRQPATGNRQPAAAPLARPAPTRAAEAGPARPAGAAPETAAAVEEAGEEASEEVDEVSARLRQVVQSHAGDLERCYQRAAKVSGPSDPLEGRIDVQLTVMPDGSARDVRAGENTTGSVQLADCVVALFRSWTLPAGAAQPVGLLWPLQFRPPAK